MTIVRWDPFRDFGFTTPNNTWTPPVDIFQTGEHELVLKAELPDMSREDIDVNIENFVLTIKGEKKRPGEVKDEQFHHVERRYGIVQPVASRCRTTVDPSRVSAVLQARRAHRAAAAARRRQAAVDQGRRRGVSCDGGSGRSRRVGRVGGQLRTDRP